MNLQTRLFGKTYQFHLFGLLYYLTTGEISNLFQSLARFKTEGNTVVFDFGNGHLFSSDVPRMKNMIAMAEKSGEPMKPYIIHL